MRGIEWYIVLFSQLYGSRNAFKAGFLMGVMVDEDGFDGVIIFQESVENGGDGVVETLGELFVAEIDNGRKLAHLANFGVRFCATYSPYVGIRLVPLLKSSLNFAQMREFPRLHRGREFCYF